MESVIARLKALQELPYKQFMENLLPTVPPEQILGVRLPHLRKLAAQLEREGAARDFLRQLPHFYLEENHLHSFLVDRLCKTYEDALRETEIFLPYVDNWALCDSFRPHALRQKPDALWGQIQLWLQSSRLYTVRLGLVLLLNWFLTDAFRPEMPEIVSRIQSEEYYVNMAVSWYFSMALVKQYDAALPYLLEHRLSPWIHNKSIQKATESLQLIPETKAYLRTLKIS